VWELYAKTSRRGGDRRGITRGRKKCGLCHPDKTASWEHNRNNPEKLRRGTERLNGSFQPRNDRGVEQTREGKKDHLRSLAENRQKGLGLQKYSITEDRYEKRGCLLPGTKEASNVIAEEGRPQGWVTHAGRGGADTGRPSNGSLSRRTVAPKGSGKKVPETLRRPGRSYQSGGS